LTPFSYTPLVETMVEAKNKAFREDFKGFKTLVVLTDGGDSEFKGDIPSYLREQFKDSGVLINFIGFQLTPPELKLAREQFQRPIEELGGNCFLNVKDTRQLTGFLERSMHRQLRFELLDSDGQQVTVSGGTTISKDDKNPEPAELIRSGVYKIRLELTRAFTQEIQ